MQIHTFTAHSAADAVAQIRAELGPEAVVLNVRKLPVEGLSRLWQKPRIEVLAHLPEPTEPVAPALDPLAELRQELAAIRQQVEQRSPAATRNVEPLRRAPATLIDSVATQSNPALSALEPVPSTDRATGGAWRVGKFLETTGLLPLYAQQAVEQLRARHGDQPPESLGKELHLARALLTGLWPTARPVDSRVHIFVGAAGSGKTTCVCKWLAQSVLVEGRTAHVWRLDGRTANTAESLSVYCEILGVPLDRFVPPTGVPAGVESLFIDLPGVNCADASAIANLARLLGELPAANVHLVLNAAYDTAILQGQVRAFAALPVTDLIFTHLDEETRWGKLWNFVFGTNFTPAFLSTGQNIPGDFHSASAEKIVSRQFPCN